MADFLSAELTLIDAGTTLGPHTHQRGSHDRPIFTGTLTLAAAQAKSKTIGMCRIPKGYTPRNLRLLTDTSLGSSKIAIGNSTTAGKYRASAVFTAVDLWVSSILGENAATALTAEEEVLVTNSADADFPAGGTFTLEVECDAP